MFYSTNREWLFASEDVRKPVDSRLGLEEHVVELKRAVWRLSRSGGVGESTDKSWRIRCDCFARPSNFGRHGRFQSERPPTYMCLPVRLAVASPPSSSPSSKPGVRSAFFKSTLYALSTTAAIAHCVFLQPRLPSPLPPKHPPRMISPLPRHLNTLEWYTVMCYVTASLGALWLLDLVRT